jgi:hypothetical protein
VAVDGGDRRHGEGGDGVDGGAEAAVVGEVLGGAVGLDFLQVGARGEDAARAGEDDAADLVDRRDPFGVFA